MADIDEESYLDSLLGSIGDVEDIVTSKEIGVEKILEEQKGSSEDSTIKEMEQELESLLSAAEPEPEPLPEPEPEPVPEPTPEPVPEPEPTPEPEPAPVEESMDLDAISAEELSSLLDSSVKSGSDTADTADISDSDMEKLKNMDLDNIIEQVKDTASDDLFKEEEQAADSAEPEDKATKAEAAEAGADEAEAEDEEQIDDEGEAVEIDKDAKKKLKKEKKKGGLFAALADIFFDDDDDDIIEQEEDSSKEEKKKNKKDKKKKNKDKNSEVEETEDETSVDENERLIEEVFGDKDTLDDNAAPEKGFFAKLKYRMAQMKKKNEEEEALEEEAEALDIEERKKKKEEDKVAKEAKKEEAKKAKAEKPKKEKKPKEKKAKPKKEKKPKPEPKPGDILKIKPKSMVMFVLFVAGVCVLILVASSLMNSMSASSSARSNFELGSYSKAFQNLYGSNISNADKSIYERSSVVMYVQRQYESYQNYMELKMYTEAINALVKGLDRYDTYYKQASDLGVAEALDDQKSYIYAAFQSSFNISQSEADQLLTEYNDNFTQYYVKIDKMGKAMGE
jgi:hypothetical protein